MYTQMIMQKMTELARGKFTYLPTREISAAVVADIYNSSPIYFGLMGKVISSDLGSVLDERLPKPIDQDNKVYLLVYQNDQAVALLNCIIDYPEQGVVFLGWMLVHGEHLFQGIGRANYQIFYEAVKSIGLKQIQILIEAQNEAATTFWTGLGFKPITNSAQKAALYNHVGIEYYLNLQNEDETKGPEQD